MQPVLTLLLRVLSTITPVASLTCTEPTAVSPDQYNVAGVAEACAENTPNSATRKSATTATLQARQRGTDRCLVVTATADACV